ncbi:MAG: TCP-1/cpn60 chaperonin family protein [Anaerolineae bacterium]|nr:TCP-1/cpn60 chaperonin family protein [Gloeobacterales cyanobacterium ES-bin-313]
MSDNAYLKVLRNNIAAVRMIVETVAPTLGPKGLDVLLTDEAGRITITNDGVEILRQLDAQHPAARLVAQAADAQDRAVGDGTTTATVLAGALLDAALVSIEQGVSINPLLTGMRQGIQCGVEALKQQAQTIVSFDDPLLLQVTEVAARGDKALAQVVWEAARRIGVERLSTGSLRLGDLVLAETGGVHHWIDGVLIGKRPLFLPADGWLRTGKVLVLGDALEPEGLDAQALSTEGGFNRFVETQNRLRQEIHQLVQSEVVLVVCEKTIAPLAEECLAEAGILALQRTLSRDTQRICQFSGAQVARRSMLSQDFANWLGKAEVSYEPIGQRVILKAGGGQPLATILVGAHSADVAAEQERVAIDACGALQAALKGGVVTGGGVAEFVCAQVIQGQLAHTEGLTRYGMQVVAIALRRPIEQIVANSGYSALEKVANLESTHQRTQNQHLGIDCESGEIANLWTMGIVDPLTVKTNALQAAGEIAERILRIQTVVRRREFPPEGV